MASSCVDHLIDAVVLGQHERLVSQQLDPGWSAAYPAASSSASRHRASNPYAEDRRPAPTDLHRCARRRSPFWIAASASDEASW